MKGIYKGCDIYNIIHIKYPWGIFLKQQIPAGKHTNNYATYHRFEWENISTPWHFFLRKLFVDQAGDHPCPNIEGDLSQCHGYWLVGQGHPSEK